MNTKHVREWSITELEQTICEFCKDPEMTLDVYLCPNCAKDNEKICTECCGCYDEEN